MSEQWTFRQEVNDKLGVVFNGCNASPLERGLHRKQCEDFLVELHDAALTAASEREAALREELETVRRGNLIALDAHFAVLAAKDTEIARLTGELAEATGALGDAVTVGMQAESALAAERQKVQEAIVQIRAARPTGYSGLPVYMRGEQNGLTTALNIMGALGLSPTEPTPKQVKCPACGDTVTVHFDGDDCSTCGEQLRTPTEPTPPQGEK